MQTTQTPVMVPRCGKTLSIEYRGGPYTLVCGSPPDHPPEELCMDLDGKTSFIPTGSE